MIGHPHDWTLVETRWLTEDETFDINEWLRGMATSDYDIVAGNQAPHYLSVYFAKKADAVWFKLAWGGK